MVNILLYKTNNLKNVLFKYVTGIIQVIKILVLLDCNNTSTVNQQITFFGVQTTLTCVKNNRT